MRKRAGGPFSIYGWLDKSFDSCWFVQIGGNLTLQGAHSSQKSAYQSSKEYELILARWLKGPDGREWMRANGVSAHGEKR